MRFRIRLAELNMSVTCIHPQVVSFCREYMTEDPAPDCMDIVVEREDIDREREMPINRDHRYSDAYLETLALYRKIAERTPAYDAVLFHGSVLSLDGDGYLFTAPSGTGKSTHARLWRERFGDRVRMVNDDKPLLRIKDDAVIAYGTPWNGKHHLGENCSARLRGICRLSRGAENRIESVSWEEVYPLLLQQTYRPHTSEMLAKTLRLVGRIGSAVPLYHLHCNMEPEAAEISRRGMSPCDKKGELLP